MSTLAQSCRYSSYLLLYCRGIIVPKQQQHAFQSPPSAISLQSSCLRSPLICVAFTARTLGSRTLNFPAGLVSPVTSVFYCRASGIDDHSEEKELSIDDLLRDAEAEEQNFIFTDQGVTGDDGQADDPFSVKQKNSTLFAGNSRQVLPSVADMSKVLSAYQDAPSRTKDITVQELAAALQSAEPPLLLDVRSPGEFSQGHAPGAINVPLPEVLSRIADGSLDLTGAQVAVICQAGGRSARAAIELASVLDLPEIANVLGGTSAWAALGFPLE